MCEISDGRVFVMSDDKDFHVSLAASELSGFKYSNILRMFCYPCAIEKMLHRTPLPRDWNAVSGRIKLMLSMPLKEFESLEKKQAGYSTCIQ